MSSEQRTAALSCEAEGLELQAAGDLEQAAAAFRSAASLFGSCGDLWSAASCFGSCGVVLNQSGDPKGSDGMHRQALGHFLSCGAEEGVARSYWGMAVAARRSRDFERCLEMVGQCRKIDREHGDFRSVAEGFGLEAEIQVLRGELSVAENLLRRSVALFERLEEPALLARDRLFLAEVYLEQERFESAIEMADSARECFECLGDARRENRAILALGRASGSLDRPQEAKAFLYKALGNFKRHKDLLGEAWSTLWIGAHACATGNIPEALLSCRRSHHLFETCRCFEGSTLVYELVGMAYELQGKTELALSAWSQARQMLEALGDLRGMKRLDLLVGFAAVEELVTTAEAELCAAN